MQKYVGEWYLWVLVVVEGDGGVVVDEGVEYYYFGYLKE